MSYLTATNLHHGPPGPLDVLSGNEGTTATYPAGDKCRCSAVGADEVREGSYANALIITTAIVGGVFYLMSKTRRG